MWQRDYIKPFDMVYVGILILLIAGGVVALVVAVVYERKMQRHRQPGVTYRDATFRRDGAWRRADLFTETGLAFQSQAARWGMIGGICLVLAVILMGLMRILP